MNEHEYGGPDPGALVLLQRNQGSGTFDLFFGDLVRKDIDPDLIDMSDLAGSLERFEEADYSTPEGNRLIPTANERSRPSNRYEDPLLNDFIPT